MPKKYFDKKTALRPYDFNLGIIGSAFCGVINSISVWQNIR